MKKLQKPIAIIIITGLVVSLNFNLFIFKPKQVQAVVDIIGGPWNPPATIKELILDTIGHTITQTILNLLEQKIMDWGQGKNTDTNQPFAVTDWLQYFKDAAILGAAKWVNEEFANTFNELDEFEKEIKNTLESIGITNYADLPTYSQYAKPTLKNDLGANYQKFIDSGYSLLQGGGQDAWFSLMKPENNIFGQVLMAQNAKQDAEEKQKEAADKQAAASGGYKNETTTTQTDIEACKKNCSKVGPPSPACLEKCKHLPGVAIQTQIKNLGSDIDKMMTSALGADMERLISTDEITELLGVLFSAITTKAINQGLAFATNLLKPDQSTRKRAETKTSYSYQRAFKKEQTIEDVKDVRSETLSNILKAMQQLSRSITTCVGDEMLKYDDYVKNLADIFSGNVEVLYIGLEGVNLKPDFEVLDPAFAPYTVYGYSWGQVPVVKFPDKCKQITDQLKLGDNATCRSIHSGLEPSTECETCMYDYDSLTCPPAPYPPQLYPETGQPNPWANETLTKQKSDYWWNCRNQYNVTLDRCDECLKKADEKCQQLDSAQKNQCIINQCGNFSDISNNIVTPLPTDPDSAALEFYNRCVKEEAKDACFTCLKEYFVPATYCDQAQDYMARSIIKYPALVKKVRNNAPDHEIWLGPYDKIMGEQGGGECDNNDEAESIDLAIICRIMPDFKYKGEKVCETRCSQSGLTGQALTDALKDITDFRPNGKDCNGIKLPIGGKETWAPVNDGVFYTRNKCCGALWQHDAAKYAACVGSGSETAVVPPPPNFCIPGWDHPECCCAENWRPVVLGRDGWVGTDQAPYGGDCFNAGFSVDGAHKFFMHMNNGSTTSDVPFIATGSCSETDENLNNTDQLPTLEENLANGKDYIGDDLPDSPPNDTDATPPSGVVWSYETEAGQATQFCIPDFSAGNYTVGVYHNDNQDIVSGIQLCQKCDPGDNGYPYYGTSLNQCTGKQDPLEVPTGCE